MTFNQASIDQAIEALKEQFGDRLSVAQSVREHHRIFDPVNTLQRGQLTTEEVQA
ncbi:TTC39/IML2 family protein [Alphaproteobacteria bacterium]|nr:TTC39/IML2 family protein [Alphaproteobacteria bacterium]